MERGKAITALAFIKDKTAAEAMLNLSKSSFPNVSEQANYWLSFRQSNDWLDLLDWKTTGLDLEKEKKQAGMKASKAKILNEKIAFWDRNSTVQRMAKDPFGGQLLIGMVAAKSLPKDLYPSVETLIFNNPDQSVRVQASNYFKRPSGKVYSITDIAKLKPDISKGKNVFTQSCANCHKAGKMGADIGPDLTLIGKKFDRVALLDAIINPNAAIVFGYEPWLINTKDGDTVFGFLLADDKTVVVKDAAGKKHVIVKENITSREKQPNSLMPDPTSMGLSEKDLANLTEYLLQLK